jgi:hypothetical protein
MSWAMNNCQVSLEIDVTHTDSDPVATHHMVNWEIKSPSASISELQQTALETNDAKVFGYPKDAVGDEVASGTSYHCKGLQRLA